MLSQNLEFHIIIVVQCILATVNEKALGTIRIRVGRIGIYKTMIILTSKACFPAEILLMSILVYMFELGM